MIIKNFVLSLIKNLNNVLPFIHSCISYIKKNLLFSRIVAEVFLDILIKILFSEKLKEFSSPFCSNNFQFNNKLEIICLIYWFF